MKTVTISFTEAELNALFVYLEVAADSERTWERFAEAMDNEGDAPTDDGGQAEWERAFDSAVTKLNDATPA